MENSLLKNTKKWLDYLNEIGLERGTVRVVPHNPRWRLLYEEEAEILQKILSKYIAGIAHIGSTAIPGIVAKLIVDIALAVKNITDVQEIIAIMESHN